MKQFRYLTLILATLLLTSFIQEGSQEINLTDKGIPVIVAAPNGAVVEEGVMNGEDFDGVNFICWEVNYTNFSLEISMDDEPMWQEWEEYVDDAKMMVESDDSFVEYVENDEYGFICRHENAGVSFYEMYYSLKKGDRMVEFAFGLGVDEESLSQAKKCLRLL